MERWPHLRLEAEPVDLADGDEVLDFAYEYLRSHGIAPSDAAVRNVTAIIARCKSAVVPYAVLESLVAAHASA